MASQVILGRSVAINANYFAVAGLAVSDSLAGYGGRSVVPHAGQIQCLMVRADAAPGAGNSYTLTLYKNGVATSLAVTISGASTSGYDNTHIVSVNPGDYLTLVRTKGGSPADTYLEWAFRFNNTADNQAIWLGAPPASPGTQYFPHTVGGDNESFYTGLPESSVQAPVALAGTLKNLYVYVWRSPGGSGALTYSFTLRKNGANTGLTLTINLPSAQPTAAGNIAADVPVSPGDVLDMYVTKSGSQVNAVYATWGFSFNPSVPNQYLLFNAFDTPRQDTVRYKSLVDAQKYSTIAWNATESNVYNITLGMALSNFNVRLWAAPGVAKSYTFVVRKNGADTALTVTISGNNTTGADTTHLVFVSPGDVVTVKCTPSGNPTLTYVSWCLIATEQVITTEATHIRSNQATGNGYMEDAANIDQIGFEWGTSSGNYPNEVKDVAGGYYPGGFSLVMTGLNPSTLYYYRAKIHHTTWGWLYGNELTFTTSSPLPETRTDPPSAATSNSIDAVGNILSTGGDASCDKRGFVYGLTSKPNPGDVAPGASGYDGFQKESGSFGAGSFTLSISGLTAGKIYYLRAYSRNSYGYAYGSEIRVLTSATVNLLYPIDDASRGIRFDSSPGGTYPNPPGSGTIAHYVLVSDLDTYFIMADRWGYIIGNYVYERNYFNSDFYTDLYALSNPFRRTEGIVKVKWKARVFRTAYPYGQYKRELKTHAAQYTGPAQDIPYGGAAVCEVFYNNPSTGAPWTLAEVDDLLAGISLGNAGGYGEAACDFLIGVALWANASVVTDVPLRLTGTTARLFGHVTEDEAETCQVYFQWGETIAYGNTTPQQTKALGESFSADIAGLDSGKTYHTRAVIVTACGETFYGADQFIGVMPGGGNPADLLVKDNFI